MKNRLQLEQEHDLKTRTFYNHVAWAEMAYGCSITADEAGYYSDTDVEKILSVGSAIKSKKYKRVEDFIKFKRAELNLDKEPTGELAIADTSQPLAAHVTEMVDATRRPGFELGIAMAEEQLDGVREGFYHGLAVGGESLRKEFAATVHDLTRMLRSRNRPAWNYGNPDSAEGDVHARWA